MQGRQLRRRDAERVDGERVDVREQGAVRAVQEEEQPPIALHDHCLMRMVH